MTSYSKWLSPREINFERDQMEGFLLPNLYDLRIGEWPPQEMATGYSQADGASGRRQRQHTAYFTMACGIAAEVGARLNKCGKYSRIIYRLNCEEGNSQEKLAREFKMHPDDFDVLWDRLLVYISGWRRKRVTFRRWLAMTEVKI
jgi:hypothetical protein